MFTIFYYLFDLFISSYVLINLVHDPNERNYMITILFYNFCVFGYMWTLYLVLIYGGIFLINNKKIALDLYPIIQSKLEINNNLVKIKNYSVDIIKKLQHPVLIHGYIMIQKLGDYATTMFKYLLLWGIKSNFPQMTEKLSNSNLDKVEEYFKDNFLIKNEIVTFKKLLNDIELLEQLHNKIKDC